MKVSKPVLIFAIVMLLLAGYIHFFTGKKKQKTASVPPPAMQSQQAKPAQAPPQQGPREPMKKPPEPPPVVDQKMTTEKDRAVAIRNKLGAGMLRDIQWSRNPFLLPMPKGEKKKDSLQAVRLLAVFQKGGDRVAVIDHEIVRRGDMVGEEKVLDIGDDNVVLARGSSRRVLSLGRYKDAVQEEEPKMKATEKGK